ncbi:MAG: bacteriohemerythrin [Nitrospiraceae bacterium]|nr:bacteriohemerythrin [Nitrospiraceae bacterium]
MTFTWTEELATEVAEIDSQHQELFRRVNGILEACREKKGRQEIGKFIEFLEDYVDEHFAGEERRMLAVGYPALSSHRAEHRDFTRQLSEIKKEFTTYGSGINVVLMAVRASGDWLVNHIRKTDRAMAARLRERSGQELSAAS